MIMGAKDASEMVGIMSYPHHKIGLTFLIKIQIIMGFVAKILINHVKMQYK